MGRMPWPGAATRYLYAGRLIAGRHHCPQCFRPSAAIPFKEAALPALPDQHRVPGRVAGWETQWLRCRGLGKSVKGRLPCLWQTTAHGQITERKLSVAHFRLSLAFAWLGGQLRRSRSPFIRASGSPSRRLISSNSWILSAGRNLSGLPICCAIRKVLQ